MSVKGAQNQDLELFACLFKVMQLCSLSQPALVAAPYSVSCRSNIALNDQYRIQYQFDMTVLKTGVYLLVVQSNSKSGVVKKFAKY